MFKPGDWVTITVDRAQGTDTEIGDLGQVIAPPRGSEEFCSIYKWIVVRLTKPTKGYFGYDGAVFYARSLKKLLPNDTDLYEDAL